MVQVIRKKNTAGNDEKTKQTTEVLKKLHSLSIEEEASRLAHAQGLPYIDLHAFPVSGEDILLLPEDEARKNGLALFHKKGLRALLAIADPTNPELLAYIAALIEKKGWQAELYVASKPSLEQAWKNYAHKTFIDNLDLVRVSLGGADLERFEADFGSLISLKEDRSVSTSRAMEIILAGARKLRGSDIHLEPEEGQVRLRYRIDGVLQEIGALPLDIYRLLVSRIKMIGKMRLNIRAEAQDGHFFVELDQKRIDIRVSIIPGKFGESINMRLLSGDDVIVDVNALGLQGLAYEEVLNQIGKPNGLVLNTGPTGSGKTTTLYTLLHRINQPDVKIITVEDPIEYSLPGIVQTEVSKNKDYTFATALRAIVRQDPDVILVGEIRDGETADISINAALTGHLVLSTLHANSAPAAVPRLLELGVRPSLITSAMNVIIAQRLVRCLCKECKTDYAPAKETIDSLVRLITIISPKAKVSIPKNVTSLWKAEGCAACHFTGYHGRIGIFEIFTFTEEIKTLINDMGTEQEILKAALENGMVTMTQDGILKALAGITSLDEVWRVVDQVDTLKNIYTDLMPNELSRASNVTAAIFEQVKHIIISIETFAQNISTLDSKFRLPMIFAAAIQLHAGDIHIEPTGTTFEIRFRLDGILKTVASFPLNEYPSFLAEIKLLAGLKSGERAGVTDGRFSINVEKSAETSGERVDIRLSIILGGFGETVVLRLLNQSVIKLELESLAIRKQSLARILTAIEKPSGMILNTGPTGSGKTTTLYSILARLNKPEIKIITVEDPIEIQMPGLLQTQVNETDGYTFATALRSLLRQNPDIMMIGEIRDEETAQIAVQAASTGHLVLSTLHTNSAAGTVSRFQKMGVSGDDLANASNLFMAQRLVRRLCDQCKQQITPEAGDLKIITDTLATLPEQSRPEIPADKHIWQAKGCPACSGTGYAGQLALTETLVIDTEIQNLIARGALTHEIEAQAIKGGMLTLVQDGILSALEGKTSLDEVKRVTEL